MAMSTGSRVGVAGNPATDAYGNGRMKSSSGKGYFNVTTGGSQTISFRLTAPCYAAVKVYNLMGRQVAMLPVREYSAGDNTVTLEVQNLPSGVYHYFLQ